MTLAELITFTRSFVQLDSKGAVAPPTGEVIDFLNEAMNQASTRLRVPITVLTVTAQSNGFNLPSDAWRTNPLVSVVHQPSSSLSVLLPIRSLEYAAITWPNWTQVTTTGSPVAVIWSGGVTGMPDVTVYPDPGSSDYVVTYVVKPTAMSALTDTPFNGGLAGFHLSLAQYAAYLMLGNPARLGLYDAGVKAAAATRNRGPRLTSNAAYVMHGRWY